eukprot:TRINITY_DN2319_c0_g1_i1.p1 TRINITY_DN2319_c0_g1~~TRINITY_DN2319_c0_g1_i1.p1  ORF type:complete len:104 (-),score=6.04 TRINITY_DN2319_c0_g1_i1:26-337(-)
MFPKITSDALLPVHMFGLAIAALGLASLAAARAPRGNRPLAMGMTLYHLGLTALFSTRVLQGLPVAGPEGDPMTGAISACSIHGIFGVLFALRSLRNEKHKEQ